MKKQTKPLEVRLQEVTEVYAAVEALGLPDDLPGWKEFRAIANAFVKDGVAASGTLPIPGTKRALQYTLSMQPHVKSMAVLRYDANV